MKRLTILTLALAVFLQIFSNPKLKWNARFQEYINQYKNIAIREMHRYGIPASITLAQGLLESGAGQSEIAVKGNNHFGIKCHGWEGRTVYHDDDLRQECFRAYDDPYESFEDHSKFLANRPRYKDLFHLSRTDYKGWAHGLKKAGYATSPTYAQRLIDLIELYRLNEYDLMNYEDTRLANKVEYSPSVQIKDDRVQALHAPHQLYLNNDNCYLVARRGDTFQSIADELDMKASKIAKYNERDKQDVLNEGDIIYLKKKRPKADKAFKNRVHVVKQGESMYSIAQKYGIRLKSLYKINNLPSSHQVRIGEQLRVY